MKELYRVARNIFSVTVQGRLPAWEAVRPRYTPFACLETDKPLLETEIRMLPLAECDAETIYEPEYAGLGFFSARASRLPDSGIVVDFLHVSDLKPRIRMTMSPSFDKSVIQIDPGGDDKENACILTHAIMIAYMLASVHTGTMLIHASSVVCEGMAYLFQGKSGTGKSTHAALWVKNNADAELLNDDNPVISFSSDGTAMAYGSPWSGKTHCYRNVAAPIGAFVRIVRDSKNFLCRLTPLNAYASLTTSVFFMPFVGDDLMAARHQTIERLAQTVICGEMHCRPDDEAALTCRRQLSEYLKNTSNQ